MLMTTIAATLAMTSAPLPPDFEQRARELLEKAYAEDGPGAVAIVVDDGRIVYHAGRGLADIEAGTPITTETVFRYASITKQFTAATILQLVAEGKVSLDAPLTDYLSEYPQPGGAATVRQLLNHTSGIMSYTNLPGMRDTAVTTKPRTTADMLDYFDHEEMPAAHGERMAYNNSGYILLGAIIERVRGKNWDVAVRERIASPLGLASLNSGIYEAGMPMMARGYSVEGDEVVPAQEIHMSFPHAAGALVGTAGDLATWAQALHSGKVVPSALYAQMIAPTTLANGTTSTYGFGLDNSDVRGEAAIGHSGGIFGFSTDSIFLPDEDVFVAVLTNSDSPQTSAGVLTRKLAALAIGKDYPEFETRALPLEQLQSVEGRYEFSDTVRDFFVEDGKFYSQREGGSRMELFFAGDDTFYYGHNSLTYFTVGVDEDGTPLVAFYGEGAEQASMGKRVGEVPSGPEDIMLDDAARAALVGTYELPIGPFTIGEQDGKMTGKLGPQPEVVLQSYAPDHLGAPQFGAEFTFVIEDGRAVSMTLLQGGQEFSGDRKDD